MWRVHAKPVEVKPKRVKKVKADKAIRGADDIKKYFIIPGESADTSKTNRPKQATMLSQSRSEQQKE